MITCNFGHANRYLLGTKPIVGTGFTFSNNLAYDNANKTLYVGPANPVSGDINTTTCIISLQNSRVKIEISKDLNPKGEMEYFFEFEIVETYTSNLFLSLADRGTPEFTIGYDNVEGLSFIGTEDIRTGRAKLPLPIEDEDTLGLVYLKYDDSKNALFINAK